MEDYLTEQFYREALAAAEAEREMKLKSKLKRNARKKAITIHRRVHRLALDPSSLHIDESGVTLSKPEKEQQARAKKQSRLSLQRHRTTKKESDREFRMKYHPIMPAVPASKMQLPTIAERIKASRKTQKTRRDITEQR